MKKIVYLAPALLLGLAGKGAMADQNTHISRLDEGFMTSLNEPQLNQAVNANKPNQEQVVQNKDVKTNDANKTAAAHISSLDSSITEDNAKANEANEIKHTATHVNSLDNNNTENNKKAVRYNTFGVKVNIKTTSNFAESKVVNDNSDQHTIKNPNNNQIIIHYVDENGATIAGLKDYTIDINNAPKGNSTGRFKVPDNRYVLPDPTSDYQLQHDKHNVHHNAVTHIVHHPEQGHEETYTIPARGHYETVQTDQIDHWEYSNGDGENVSYGTGNEHLTPEQVATHNYDVATPIYRTESEWVEDSPSSTGTQWVVDREAWDQTVVDKPAYDQLVGDNIFSDNSKNIKSIVGNTVNVILKHGTRNVDANNSDMELDSWRKVHAINSDNQSNLTNKSVKFKVGYTLDLVSSAKVADLASYKAVSNPNDFISENNLTNPVGFSAINNKLLSISL